MPTMRFRPLDAWPKGELTPPEARRPSPFEATYDATLDLLDYELNRLGVTEVVVQVAVGDRGVRVDGGLRADARPDHPGVVVSYTDPRQGPLVFATDRFGRWQANLRAIALGLEALRKVDRYGITTKGEQYTGWIDHRDGDGLNNRRTNLRRATTSQNGGNMAPRPSRHGYKGVTPARSRWAARIMVGYRRRHLGTFDSPEEAARAYDEAAREAWGEYARTNFPAIPAAG